MGLAASPWEKAAAVTFGLALTVVVIVEILTPNDVVGSLGFLPLMAAMWTLSSRLAAAVGLAAVLGFWLVLAAEANNRTTVLLIAGVGLVMALLVRMYATRLDKLLATSRHPFSLSLPATDGVDSLSRRELEIAGLASRGHTAGEIGRQLHISERTVESHLANAYAKLAIHSRAALRRMID